MPILARPERPDVARRVGDPRVPLAPAVASNLLVRLTRQEIERAAPDIDYVSIMTAPGRRQGVIFDRCVGSLGVLGYSRAWLAQRLRVNGRHLAPGADWRAVDPRLMHSVLTAAIRIGSRWATPESTGQTSEQIKAAHEQAIDGGYLVPAGYGPRYQNEGMMAFPWDSDFPPTTGRPKRTPEQTIAAKIQAVAYFCEHGGTERGVGEQFGLSDRTVGRTRREDLGIEVVATGQNYTGVAPGQDDIVAAVVRAANAIAIGDSPREAWARLHSYATTRKERLAAERAARDAREAWVAQGAISDDREDAAA